MGHDGISTGTFQTETLVTEGIKGTVHTKRECATVCTDPQRHAELLRVSKGLYEGRTPGAVFK